MTAITTVQTLPETHVRCDGVVAPSSRQAIVRPTPEQCPPDGTSSDTVPVHSGPDNQPVRDGAVSPSTTIPAVMVSTPRKTAPGGGHLSPLTEPTRSSTPTVPTVPWEAYDELRVLAESLTDCIQYRIGVTNRLRSGTIPADITAEVLADLNHTEKVLRRTLRKSFRRAAPEVAAWVKETPGLGEESMARLLGCIGHPVIARPHRWMEEAPEGHTCGNTCGDNRHLVALESFERSVSQLWSYCGHGDPARRKRKGMTAEEATATGSPQAKMLVHLIAECAMKCQGTPPNGHSEPETLTGANGTGDATRDAQPTGRSRRRSPYRDTYDQRKAITAERDDWTQGHKHNDALRITGKTILRDLWLVAR